MSNPYAQHAGESYFAGHDSLAKERAGQRLAAQAEGLLGRKGRLLELGCGRGELLKGAAQAGWEVRGVDMTPAFAETASELGIELSSAETARSLDQSHDFVILAAILEHLYDPRACLLKVRASLVSGGLVFIDVPNECGLWARMGNAYMKLRGRDWAVNLSPTFPPYHVVGFCPRSLRRLLAATGFEVVSLRTVEWRNDLADARSPWQAFERRAASLVLKAGPLVGMGAGIVCWARKRGPAEADASSSAL